MLVLVLTSLAHAAEGNTIAAEIRGSRGELVPAVRIQLIDPPDPDAAPAFRLGERSAETTLRYAGDHSFGLLLDPDERSVGVEAVYYLPSDGSDKVLVAGRGAVDKYYPPDPCSDPDLPPGPCRWPELPPGPCAGTGELPPGPCFEFLAILGDGSVVGINVVVQSDGIIDPGSLVGFNPQPDPPGSWRLADPPGEHAIALSFDATARDEASLSVTVTLSQEGEALALQ